MNLQVLKDALDGGLRVGVLVHEKTGATCRVEVVAVDGEILLALAEAGENGPKLFAPETRVRVELPREGSVIHVPGRIAGVRPAGPALEVEIVCPEGAEERQRRADARVAADCRLRLHDGAEWEETSTVNLSAGGVLVEKGGSAHAGDLVDIELELDGEPLRCEAEVVRRGVKSGGVSSRINAALRFVGLTKADRERIVLFVLSIQARQKAAARARH